MKCGEACQQNNIIKDTFWWFYVHVEVDITILYCNWSKNHIGTKLEKTVQMTGMGTG